VCHSYSNSASAAGIRNGDGVGSPPLTLALVQVVGRHPQPDFVIAALVFEHLNKFAGEATPTGSAAVLLSLGLRHHATPCSETPPTCSYQARKEMGSGPPAALSSFLRLRYGFLSGRVEDVGIL